MAKRGEQPMRTAIWRLYGVDLRSLKPPAHPNPTKERAMGKRGEQPMRTALWRLYGVDLTRIDAISTGAAQVALTEVGLDLSAFPDEHHFVSWLRLSPKMAFSAGKVLKKRPNSFGAIRFGRQAAEQNAQRNGCQPNGRHPAHVRADPAPLPERAGSLF
jgi:hypothetical protein